MLEIEPGQLPTAQFHQYMLGAVAPRPIAFVSSLSEAGQPNLAPYSFFNAFSSKPPILVFSSNRRVRDNSTKDTLANVLAVPEVVINVVSHSIVRQMALASIEYPADVNEFEKAGFTALPSRKVKPMRVAESPVQMECRVNQVLPLGEEGGAGHLVICEILLMHIHESVLNEKQQIDPKKIDLMARMGGAWYCRASGDAVMQIVQPVEKIGIGFDGLPQAVRHSNILTGNELAELAAFTVIPEADDAIRLDPTVMDALAGNENSRTNHLHRYAQQLIQQGDAEKAWQVLLASW